MRYTEHSSVSSELTGADVTHRRTSMLQVVLFFLLEVNVRAMSKQLDYDYCHIGICCAIHLLVNNIVVVKLTWT